MSKERSTPGSGTSMTQRLSAGLGSVSTSMMFEQAMSQTRMAVCIADPNQDDCPIIFCNRAFLDLTGYNSDDVLGRNCRFLQGPETSPATVSRIREAIEGETVLVTEILNYRKSGEAFWNALHIGPIYDETGRLTYFFGSQWDVSDIYAARADERMARMMEREVSHRMRNMFSTISALVTMVGRASEAGREVAEAINERIRALSRAHEASLSVSFQSGEVDPSQLFDDVVAPYKSTDDNKVNLRGTPIELNSNLVSIMALFLDELATRSGRRGALSTEGGQVRIAWDRNTDGTVTATWTERPPPPPDHRIPGVDDDETWDVHASPVGRIVEMSGGRIDSDWKNEVLRVTLELDNGHA